MGTSVRKGACATMAAAGVSIALLAGCQHQDEVSGHAVPVRTSNPPTPAPAAPSSVSAVPGALAELGPPPPGEAVLFTARGRGDDRRVYRGEAASRMALYATCSGGGRVLFADTRSRAFRFAVPCDGVVSRLQVYTDPGQSWELAATGPGRPWRVMLTTPDS